MNPLDKWEELRIKEITEGGNPTICIMGHYTHAEFCGAVAITLDIDSFGHSDQIFFHGIRIFCSRSKKEGTMFA